MFELLAAVLASATFLIGGTYIVDLIIKAPTYKGEKSGHFNGKTFRNIDGIKARGLTDIIKWAATEDPGEWKNIENHPGIYGEEPEARIHNNEIRITFVNHATFLIQVDGKNILTDPVWSDRASPFQLIGPKRMRPPGIRFQDLPHIDAVLISHNHYDHLDIHTVKKLHERYSPHFIAPLGVPAYLRKHGIEDISELDWWEEQQLDERIKVSAVPAQHFSGRGLSDRDKTLWCGFMLECHSGNIYFAGDTGYDGFFEEIGEQFNPIDTALIPIGAYRPRWFMEPIHVDPEQAVLIHKKVRADTSIGMHFGTFPLADDGMHEPKEDLARARRKHGLSESDFITLEEGEAYRSRIKEERKLAGSAI